MLRRLTKAAATNTARGPVRVPVACSLRQLQSAPQTGLPLRTSSDGLVDFIGFEGDEYVMQDPLPKDPEHLQQVLREREFKRREYHRRIRQHPAFQPLVRVANEMPELELAGALLDKVKNIGRAAIGKPELVFGELQYVDKFSGEQIRFEAGRPCSPQEDITIKLAPLSITVTHKAAVWAGRAYGDYVVEEAVDDCWKATESELDQVVCISPYIKMSSCRNGTLDPAGNARLALAHASGLTMSSVPPAFQAFTGRHAMAPFGCEISGRR